MMLSTTPEQLAMLRDALERGDDVTPKLRGQLLSAIYDLGLYMAIEEKQSQRGIPIAANSWLAGRLAAALHETHGVSLKDAVRIAQNKHAPEVSVSAIELKCRQVRKGKTPIPFKPLDPIFVDEALNMLHRRIEETSVVEIWETPVEARKVEALWVYIKAVRLGAVDVPIEARKVEAMFEKKS